MNIKQAIRTLLMSDISNYKISKEVGIAQTTLGDYTTGKSKLGNMKLDHAMKLYEYYTKNEEEINMSYALKQIKEIALPGSWELAGMEVITGLDDTKEIVEEMAHLYVKGENYGETASQYILRKLEDEDRVKEADAYEEEADDIMWVDEIDRWIVLD